MCGWRSPTPAAAGIGLGRVELVEGSWGEGGGTFDALLLPERGLASLHCGLFVDAFRSFKAATHFDAAAFGNQFPFAVVKRDCRLTSA
jgi:hypothetical protein